MTGRPQPRVLYLTADGVLEPLGRSQVLRYVCGLADRGFPYTLVSLEKENDLRDAAAIQRTQAELAGHGVRWEYRRYREGGSMASVLGNVFGLWRAAGRAARRDGCGLVHARSYVAASVAWMLRRRHGTPYLFDARGYWIDERAEEGRWFTWPFLYRRAKGQERRLFRGARAVVTLTELQAGDLRQEVLRDRPQVTVRAIPTCTDYEEFRPDRGRDAMPPALQQQLAGKLVVGLVGSINRSYCVDEGFLFFRKLRELRADAHLLCLTRQREEMQSLLSAAGIPPENYTLATVAHEEMPDWLPRLHWALLLLRASFAKRGSMPTKLAEFFAAGVRPIQHGCNAEVSQWVRESGLGLVLEDLTESGLQRAAEQVARHEPSPGEVARARERTRSHFGLEAGLSAYACILGQLLAKHNP